MTNIIGTQGDKGRDGEADSQIQHESDGDSGYGEAEPVMAQCCNAIAGGCKGKHSGIERYMTHIEGNAEEGGNLGRHTHEVAKHDAGAPSGDIVIKPVGEPLHPVGTDFQAERVLSDGGGDAVVDGKVFAPSADEAGEPQQNSSEGGIDGRGRGEGMQRLVYVVRVFGGEIVPEEEVAPEMLEENGPNANSHDVAERSGKLGSADGGGEVSDLAAAGCAAVLANDSSESGGRH